MQRRALDVAGDDEREQQAAEEEHQPREAERALGDEADDEVDRRGDEALDDAEQGGLRRASS